MTEWRKGDDVVAEGCQPELGARLRTARRQAGLSQTQLAGELSPSYVSLVEAGKREPSMQVLRTLADRLGCSVDFLTGGVDGHERERALLELRAAQVARIDGRRTEAARLGERLRRDRRLTAIEQREALTCVAAAREALGELEAAIGLWQELWDTPATGVNERVRVAVALCRCCREVGDLSRSIDIGERTLAELPTGAGEEVAQQGRLVATLAAAYWERGDLSRAGQLLTGLMVDDEHRTLAERGAAYWNASLVTADRGDPVEALRLADRALALFSEDDDERNLARLQVAKAWLLARQDPPRAAEALELLRRALPGLTRYGGQVDLAYAETELARVSLLLGDPHAAEAQVRSALSRLGAEPRVEAGGARTLLGRILLEQERRPEATRELLAAAEHLEQAQSGRHAASAWRELADVLLDSDEPRAAAVFYQRALDGLGLRSAPVAGPGPVARPVRTT